VAAAEDGTSPPRGRHRHRAQPRSSKPEPSQPEPSRPEPSRPEPSRPEPSQPEPSRPSPPVRAAVTAAQLPGEFGGPGGAIRPYTRPIVERAIVERATDGHAAGGKAADGQAAGGKVADGHAAGGKAAGGKAADGQAAGEGAANEQAFGEHAAGEQPAGEQANGHPNGRLAAAGIRSDTLPDWRPEPGIFDRPASTDAVPQARPARATEASAVLKRLLSARGWPLALVLAIQAVLSLRLVWNATAYIDEGLYLSVGHLELNHFLHHAAMPNVAGFMSGSPVVYPPLAALADDIGGLAGARLLSLAFMLIATVALHAVTRRLLSSRPAAFFAAALFAWLGTAQFLGAFATYDAMALMLLALATWLGVRAIELEDGLRYTLVCGAALCMAAADAAKYAAALFNPVVIVAVALAAWRADGRKVGLDTVGAMVLTAALPLTLGFDLAGSSYGQGITSTTLTRAEGTATVREVLDLSVHATGIIAVLAVLGAIVITARRPGWTTVLVAWALAGAVFLAPAEQARIHTLTSLFKHVGYGAWFACVIAGYLLAEFPALLARLSRTAGASASGARPRWALLAGTAAGAAVVLAAGAFGVTVANGQHDTWPDSRPMIADLSRLVRPTGIYLVEDPNVVTYYLRTKVPFGNIDDTYVFDYADPRTHKTLINDPAYADAIRHAYFAGIVLAFGDTFATDQLIVKDISQDNTYRLVNVVPYRDSYGPGQYQIWLRVSQPQRSEKSKRAGHRHRKR